MEKDRKDSFTRPSMSAKAGLDLKYGTNQIFRTPPTCMMTRVSQWTNMKKEMVRERWACTNERQDDKMHQRESESKTLSKRAAMNVSRVHRSESDRCTKTESFSTESSTACLKRNEVKKPGNKTEMPRIKVTNSLTQLFNTLTSEGVIVQTALGPDGSFKVGRNGDLAVLSAGKKDCFSKEMWVFRLLRMCSSAAYISSRPTVKVLTSIHEQFCLAMLYLTFPKSDIELLKDKRKTRVQLTTSTKEDDLEIWSELEASISIYFAYLVHFTICIVSFLAYFYFM